MPNNTDNVLVINGSASDVKAIRDLLVSKDKDKNLHIDFNAVVPMPEELNVVSGSHGDEAYACLHGTDKDIQHYFDYSWVKEAGVKTREELIDFLEKRAGTSCKEEELSWRELGDRYASNLEKYGHKTWYDWKCANWGTKWGAYNSEIEEYHTNEEYDEGIFIVGFQTAWSAPTPIYEKLKEMFEEADIQAYWSDEGSYERSRVF